MRKTYEAYDRIPEIVSNIELTDQVLEQLIIGTYGSFTPHQSAAAMGSTARNEYLSGIDPAQKQQRLREITATTVNDLRSFSTLFENMVSESHRAIIGNRLKIEQDRDLFDTVSEL